jgi:glycosyltransferase involved in cell wall biosynthesis
MKKSAFGDIQRVVNLLIRVCLLLVNPLFHLRFSREAYLNSNFRPYGWWRLFPKLHYCVFNAGKATDAPVKRKIKGAKHKKGRQTVLFVSHELTRTGAPILLLNLMEALQEKYNIALLSMDAGELLEEFSELASWIAIPGDMCANRKKFMKRQIQRISSTLDVKFAIVNTIVCSEALPILRRVDIPTIHLIHEFSMGRENKWWLELSSRYANATVFSSELVKNNAIEKVAHIENPKTYVIPQGIFDPSREARSLKNDLPQNKRSEFTLKHPGEILVMGAGTVDYRKGVDLFLACAKQTTQRIPELKIRFVWVGHGFRKNIKPYAMFLKDQIDKYDLGDRFITIDEVKDFKEVCRQADIFFLSSRLDPLPIVAQTALGLGIPVICFESATGTAEFLRTDKLASSGVVPYLDTNIASERIIQLAQEPALREKVGLACRKVAETCFNKDSYVSKLDALADQEAVNHKLHNEDVATIKKSGLFNSLFAVRKRKDDPTSTISNYVYSWRHGGLGMRKPHPGFHPGIYREDRMDKTDFRDPFAEYIRKGMPPGRWSQNVINPIRSETNAKNLARSALHLHFYYTESAEQIIERASLSKHRPDLLISVTTDAAAQEVEKILQKKRGWKHLIKIVPNTGRDVAPFLTAFAEELSGYDIIGHAHAKESSHHPDRSEIERWNTFLLENMIGGKFPMIDHIISSFQHDKNLGVVYADDPHVINWTDNRQHAEALASRMGFGQPLPENINFPVGTMFWARFKALKPLFDLQLGWDDYPQEPVPVDGTMLHAIERLIPWVAEQAGYTTAVTHIPGIYR